MSGTSGTATDKRDDDAGNATDVSATNNADRPCRHFLTVATSTIGAIGAEHEEVLDLVCHMVVPMSPSRYGSHWSGDEFYFCSVFCQPRFVGNPSAYVPQQDFIDQLQHRDSDHAAA